MRVHMLVTGREQPEIFKTPAMAYPWSVFLGLKSENDPRWVVFEYSSNLTKVRVLADSHGLGDQGLGTGLVVRGAAVVKSTIMVF
jgi:hypothetical protein